MAEQINFQNAITETPYKKAPAKVVSQIPAPKTQKLLIDRKQMKTFKVSYESSTTPIP